MSVVLNIPSPLQQLAHPIFSEHGVSVFVKRDDLIHDEISGNKWRKLKYVVEKIQASKHDALLTFGGAFSNHIAATAAMGKYNHIKTIGIIRGDELTSQSNQTLKKASSDGMELIFVPRSEYEFRYERPYHEELRAKYGNILIIEEGGANHLGVYGCSEILSEIEFEADHIYLAAGTGTTAAGILLANTNSMIHAVAVLKGGNFLEEEIRRLLYYALLDDDLVAEKINLLRLHVDYHFGGYGKFTSELLSFMKDFQHHHKIQLDPIYTAKMAFAFMRDLTTGKIKPGSKVVLVHTGGLQGISDGMID